MVAKGPRNINIKKREITAQIRNFAWEAMPYKEALKYLQEIEDSMMDYYVNYRTPLR